MEYHALCPPVFQMGSSLFSHNLKIWNSQVLSAQLHGINSPGVRLSYAGALWERGYALIANSGAKSL